MNLEPSVLQVHIEDIIPNRFQPRLSFDDQGLKELSDSIKEHGIIQPLVLRKLGDKYEIIAGERRYKAAQMAGLQTVPAVIANIDDNKSAEIALVENVQRRDLTAIEEARSYKSLLDKGYLTQDQLAKRMGLSQPAIANKLRLLNLDEEVQQALLEDKISERHARTLLSLEDKNAQREWLHRIINERLTVRQLDLELRKLRDANQEDSEEESSDVPIVSAMPSIEDIKANAVDLKDAKKTPNVEPNEIETLEDTTPSSPLETLDNLEPSNSNLNIPNDNINPNLNLASEIPNNQNNNSSFTQATMVPEFNIATPNSASTFISQDTLQQPQEEKKYFGMADNLPPIEEQPQTNFMSAADFSNNQANSENQIEEPNSSPKLEIFDAPATDNSFINDFKQPEEPKVDIMPPINNQMSSFNQDYNPMEINASNKYFTPIQDERPEITINNNQNTMVDPMDAVANLNNENSNNSTSSDGLELKDAIAAIRSCIESLGDQGFFINVEEIDFDSNYQITMQIHKDN